MGDRFNAIVKSLSIGASVREQLLAAVQADEQELREPGSTEPFVGAERAGEFLGITRQAVHEAARRGDLPAWRLGERRLRFKLSELERLAVRVVRPK